MATQAMPEQPGRWIWSDLADPAPTNRFTWFRTVVDLDTAPDDATIRFAADSTAQLWVNGHVLRRKVTRYHEPMIRAERVDAARWLRPGRNVVVVLHHNWGDIRTFQRTGNVHAGLFVQASWVHSDADWRYRDASEFLVHEDQFVGVHGGDRRIRFPVRRDATRFDPTPLHDADHDVGGWPHASVVPVADAPWPEVPLFVETPGQREVTVSPAAVVAAGTTDRAADVPVFPRAPGTSMTATRVLPDPRRTTAAAALTRGEPLVLEGAPGETAYVTVDFHRPVHGYPTVSIGAGAGDDAILEFGYGEIVESLYDGSVQVTVDGAIDVDKVVAPGYSDQLRPAAGARSYELPDERTARWLTVHVTFGATGRVVIDRLGIVSSQYPVVHRGSFSSGNDRLDQVVRLALVHAEVTMTDTYVDTPGREDGQWIEDARPRALLAERWFGDTALRRLMIRTLADGQGDDGQLHPFFPSNYPAYPATWDWSVQWVAMVADDHRWTGDLAFQREYLPRVRRYWDRLLEDVRADGLWVAGGVLGDVRNGDGPGPTGSSGLITPWIVDRLRASAAVAVELGADEDAATWNEAADRMAEAFRRVHVVRDRPGVPAIVADVAFPDEPDRERAFGQAAQVVALADGLIDADDAEALIDHVFPAPDGSPPAGIRRWNNPTWSYRVLRALSLHGHADRAVAHLLERTAPSLPGEPRNATPLALQGPLGGPLPEYWVSREDLGLVDGEPNPTQPEDPTGSHGWAAMPLLWLHDTLLGVSIAEPGGALLDIRPTSAGLPFVSGTTMTPRGAVFVHLEPAEPRLTIDLPADCRATITLPSEFDGVEVRDETGAVVERDSEGAVQMSGPGSVTFVAGRPRW